MMSSPERHSESLSNFIPERAEALTDEARKLVHAVRNEALATTAREHLAALVEKLTRHKKDIDGPREETVH